jgi:hypothetical protein
MLSLRIGLIACAAVLAGAIVAGTASAEARYTKAASIDIDLNFGDNDRVCCKRGQRDWWASWQECRNAGGNATANRACRDDRANYRGDARVCCMRGRHDWWSTQRDCRRSDGEPTTNRACRDDRDNRVFGLNEYKDRYNSDGYNADQMEDPYGNPDRRVCCNSRNGTTWSTWRECRRVRGDDVANKSCRN